MFILLFKPLGKAKEEVLLHKNIDSKKCSYQLSHDADWVKNYGR